MAARRASLETLKRSARHPLWWLPDPAAQQDEAYRRIWQNLRTRSEVQDGRHDTPAWRAHEGPFAMCCVRVPTDSLSPQLADLRMALEAFPFTRIHPDAFLHIPVQEIGFINSDPVRRDEVTPGRLDEFIAQAQRPLRDFPKFPVILGPVNSFADAAFLDVDDDGWLSRIHRRLLDFIAVTPSTRYPYVPHMTIAHYDRVAPIGNLPGVLAEWRDLTLGDFVVESVDVVHVSTQEAFPPLDVIHSFPLGTTRATGEIPRRPGFGDGDRLD